MEKFERRNDGSFFPSDELLREVKKNPEKYPDAVADFSKLSGESEDYIKGKIELSDYVPAGTSLIKGMVQGVENVLSLPTDLVGMDEVSDQIKGSVSDSIYTDPESTTQNLGQLAGQLVAPVGLAGPISKGLAGASTLTRWVGTAAAEGALSAAFLDSDQNIVNTLDSFGLAPDAIKGFAATEEDSNAYKRLKTLTTDGVLSGIISFGFMAGSKAAQTIFKRLKAGEEVPPEELAKAADEVQTELAEDTGVPRDSVLEGPEMTDEALAETVEAPIATQALQQEFKLADDTAPALTEVETKALKVEAAKEQLKQDLILAETGMVPDNLPTAFRAHIEEAIAPAQRFAQTVTDPAQRARLETLWNETGKPLALNNAVSVFKFIQRGEIEKAIKLAKKQVDLGDATLTLLHQGALIRTTLSAVESKFDEIIKAIRSDPKLKTKKAYQQVAVQTIQSHVGLHEVYRSLGRSASYQMLLRKSDGTLKGLKEEFDFIDELEAITNDLTSSYFNGMTQEAFTIARAKEVFDLGLNPLDVMDEIERVWKDFEGIGVPKKFKGAAMAEVSNNLIRNIKELQNTALLSTLTTTGINAVSTALQTVSMPMYRVMNGQVKQGLREYIGYMHGLQTAFRFAKKAWVDQMPVLSRSDRMETLTGTWLKASERKTILGSLMVRAFKSIVDLQLATDEFFKHVRYQGVRYADGIGLAKAAGKTKDEAHQFALDYLKAGVGPDGRGLDPVAVAEANRAAFNEIFDDRYLTGKMLGAIEKWRLADDVGGLAATLVIPFQRTPMAIFNTAMHTTGLSAVTAPPLYAIEKAARRLGYKGSKMNLKIHDDLLGLNGVRRAQAARAQMAIGAMMATTLYFMEEAELITLRGPTKMADWKGQRSERDLLPPSSLTVGNETYDLNRFLPFSAPMIAYGAVADSLRDSKLTQTGQYMGSEDPYALAMHHTGSFAYANYAMLRDAASFQGVSNLLQGLAEMLGGDTDRFETWAARVPTQFIPGQAKMVARALNEDAQEGFDFWSRLHVAASGTGGYRKLDVFGNQVQYNTDRAFYPAPYNVDHMAKPHYQEVYTVMQMTGKPIGYMWPTQVFAKELQDAGFGQIPSLHELTTDGGRNAWEAYRDYTYTMKTNKELKVTVSGTNVGSEKNEKSISFEVPKGLTFERSIEWLIEQPVYKDGMDYELRRKAIESVLNKFEANAKDRLEGEVTLPEEVLESYQFGEAPKGAKLGDLKDLKYAATRLRRTNPDVGDKSGLFKTIKSPLDEAIEAVSQ